MQAPEKYFNFTFSCSLSFAHCHTDVAHRLSRWIPRESKLWADSCTMVPRHFHRSPSRIIIWALSFPPQTVHHWKWCKWYKKMDLINPYWSICQVMMPVPIWSMEASPVPLFLLDPVVRRQRPMSSSYLSSTNYNSMFADESVSISESLSPKGRLTWSDLSQRTLGRRACWAPPPKQPRRIHPQTWKRCSKSKI